MKQKQIEFLKKEIAHSNKLKKKLAKKITNRQKYLDFLETVLENTHDFTELIELIQRHETLDLNLNELMQLDQDNDAKYKMMMIELSSFKEVS